ncbi:MAG: hypothetical protein ACXWJC_03170 [Croceibacterium sp.]
MFDWLMILVATIAMLLATYWLGEWVSRRIAAKYAVRRGQVSGFEGKDSRDRDTAEG